MSKIYLTKKHLEKFRSFCGEIGLDPQEETNNEGLFSVRLKSGNRRTLRWKDSNRESIEIPACLHGLVWTFMSSPSPYERYEQSNW